MTFSLVFISWFLKKIDLKAKRITLRTDSAAPSGDQESYTMFFPWPPLEAGLSNSTLCVLFARCL